MRALTGVCKQDYSTSISQEKSALKNFLCMIQTGTTDVNWCKCYANADVASTGQHIWVWYFQGGTELSQALPGRGHLRVPLSQGCAAGHHGSWTIQKLQQDIGEVGRSTLSHPGAELCTIPVQLPWFGHTAERGLPAALIHQSLRIRASQPTACSLDVFLSTPLISCAVRSIPSQNLCIFLWK